MERRSIDLMCLWLWPSSNWIMCYLHAIICCFKSVMFSPNLVMLSPNLVIWCRNLFMSSFILVRQHVTLVVPSFHRWAALFIALLVFAPCIQVLFICAISMRSFYKLFQCVLLMNSLYVFSICALFMCSSYLLFNCTCTSNVNYR